MLLLPIVFSLLAIATAALALNPQLLPPGRKIPIYERDSCAPSYVKCAPPGATGTSIPVIGPAVKGLYLNVLESVQGDKLEMEKRQIVADAAGFPNGRRLTDDVVDIALKPLTPLGISSKRGMLEKPQIMRRQLPLTPGGQDYYDVSLVDGSNLPLDIVGGSPASAGHIDLKISKRDASNTSPVAADIKDVLDELDIEADEDRLHTLVEELAKSGESLPELNLHVDLHKRLTMDKIEEKKKRKRATTVQMCCAAGTQCLLLKDFNVPFCWDKFTTNFFLPFSSYGSLTSGNYTSPAPPNAPPNTPSDVNLLSGNYTRPDGSSGNIYLDDEAAKPNTATLGSLMPTPWTSTGVGSAIPASALGGIATWTTVIEGTTISPSVISGYTLSGTTVAPVTMTVTGFEQTTSSTGAANSTSSKGVAPSGGRGTDEWMTRMAVAVAGMLYAVMGL